MRILIGVDDTDDVDSIGTGELLKDLCGALTDNNLGRTGFITRHQLFIHEDIPYTTHNSASCCDMDTDDLTEVVDFCRSYIDKCCADGASCGLCIIDLGKITRRKRLIRFGYAAKNLVLEKKDALDVAELHGRAILLSEHGGTGWGLIGALAACGLRMSGNDGTLQGSLEPPQDRKILTVGELCRTYALTCALTTELLTVDKEDSVNFCCRTKAVLINHKPSVYLAKDRSGKADWCVYGIQQLNGLVN